MLYNSPGEAQNACIALLGGGGKTALLHRLGDELAAGFDKVLISSLTKSGISALHTVHFLEELHETEWVQHFKYFNPLYVMGRQVHKEKLSGLSADELDRLRKEADVTVFECDGARNRPLKAHEPHDPVVPDYATHTIIVVGADSVNAKIDAKLIHRPELFREKWGVKATDRLNSDFIAKVVTSKYGYLEKVPEDTQLSYLVNKCDEHPLEAEKLARSIRRISNAPVFKGSVQRHHWEKVV